LATEACLPRAGRINRPVVGAEGSRAAFHAFPESEERNQMAKGLAMFTIDRNDDGFLIHIEDEEGETLDLTTTYEQLDLIAEAIDEQLSEDEEDIEADGEEE
jgi:hypothetical protein